tara:strand:- start:520 stop:684 length:165 start_codon:yes stop_codon:yes gene_type:complete
MPGLIYGAPAQKRAPRYTFQVLVALQAPVGFSLLSLAQDKSIFHQSGEAIIGLK